MNEKKTSAFRTIEVSNPRYERDGLRFLTVKTQHLRGRGDICLFVPSENDGLKNLPIYILLHGVYGSAWSWPWQGGAHLTTQKLISEGAMPPAILAMPSDGLWGDGSGYLSHHRRRFGEWIVSDVPAAIRESIPQASAASPLCIGGLSMGGYGALILGSKYPKRFRAIATHSAITRFSEMEQFVEEPILTYQPLKPAPDVIDLLRINRNKLPPLRFDCGVQDPLLEGNRLLHQQLEKRNIPHQYEEFPGGHEWSYWQQHLESTLHFFAEASQ